MEDRCICCGEIVPEGRQVCPECENGGKQMTPEEIVRALKQSCSGCNYHENPSGCCVFEVLGEEAADLIETLTERAEKTETERDAAIEDMEIIAHGSDVCDMCADKNKCHHPASCPEKNYYWFEWRGVRKEEK